MFQTLHFRLTCLCALITIGILSLFASLYLYISEKTLQENRFLSFQNNMNALCTSLEQQSIITFEYLLKLEQNGEYYLFLWEKQTPFFFNQMEHHAPYQDLAQKLLQEYVVSSDSLTDLDADNSMHQEFLYQDLDGLNYDVCIARIMMGQLSAAQNLASDKEQGLILLVLAPRTQFQKQLTLQRNSFGLLAAGGGILFIAFAWFFTGRLLQPIQENHNRQLQFISDASHELRTPLAVIQSCISVQQPHYKEIIQQECIHMGRLVEDLLSLNGFVNKTRQLRFEPTEPDTLLLNLYEQMEGLSVHKGLQMSIKLPEEELPRFWADPDRVQQVLLILVQNAISYTPSGGEICLRVYHKRKEMVFEVADTGTGVKDEEKEKIFERFYRSDSSHTEKEHFGLGLCIAKEIMTAHQGKIRVLDTPGGGATFRCIFPLKNGTFPS